MKIKITELEKLLTQAASKFVSLKEAIYFSKQEVDTHLKKYPRTNPLKDAFGDLESWKNNPKNKVEVQVNKPGALLLNFNKLGPSLKIKYIHDELEKRARKNGIAMVGINNSGGIHTLNLWTDGLASRDLIGICVFNGGPDSVVPFGGTRGIFGTNPISYSIPTLNKPIICDMATSEIPYFEVKQAKNNNAILKKGVAVDQEGEPTTNPKIALNDTGIANLLPIGGGYKGYALVLLIEILTGSFVRSYLSTEMSPKYILEEHGGLIIAIDIGTFIDVKKFKNSVSKMCQLVRSQKPAKWAKGITIPGDRSYQKVNKLVKNGEIEIEDNLYRELKKGHRKT